MRLLGSARMGVDLQLVSGESRLRWCCWMPLPMMELFPGGGQPGHVMTQPAAALPFEVAVTASSRVGRLRYAVVP